MADQKLTQLTEMTTPSDDDLMYMVDNPGGTPASRKITWANIKANIPSGAVVAVFGRTGLVLASTGDYLSSQIEDDSAVNPGGALSDSLEILASLISTKQDYSATLAAIGVLGSAANKYLYTTGVDSWAEGDITAFIRTLLDDSDASTARNTLELGTLATQDGTFSGGGTLATGGFTLTVPATGTSALLGANTFTGEQNLADQLLTRPVIKDYGEAVNAIGSTGGGTQDIDLTLGNVVSATVDTSANTFTFSNPSASGTACSFTLILTNGGSQTVNWPASVTWAGGTEPTLTASGVDVLTFFTTDAGTTWRGFAAGLDMS